MAVEIEVIKRAILIANAEMLNGLEQELNDADTKLGDGDTGGMLARVIGRMAEVELSQSEDIGTAFSALARSAAAATGSSFGTLLATALMAMSRETKGYLRIESESFSELLEKARDAMMARGNAKLGDKTVVDSIDFIIAALASRATLEAASDATEAALEAYRNRQNKVGRARMFGEATIGIDDPGMVAIARICKAWKSAF